MKHIYTSRHSSVSLRFKVIVIDLIRKINGVDEKPEEKLYYEAQSMVNAFHTTAYGLIPSPESIYGNQPLLWSNCLLLFISPYP